MNSPIIKLMNGLLEDHGYLDINELSKLGKIIFEDKNREIYKLVFEINIAGGIPIILDIEYGVMISLYKRGITYVEFGPEEINAKYWKEIKDSFLELFTNYYIVEKFNNEIINIHILNKSQEFQYTMNVSKQKRSLFRKPKGGVTFELYNPVNNFIKKP